MKRKLIGAVLLMALGVAAAGCHRDGDTPMYMMTYTVDGAQHSQALENDASLDAFIGYMAGLALEGHRVVFYDSVLSARHAAPKDIVTFTTTDEAEATAWAAQMYKRGYSVTMAYSPSTGVYVCVADDVTATAPVTSLNGTVWVCRKSIHLVVFNEEYNTRKTIIWSLRRTAPGCIICISGRLTTMSMTRRSIILPTLLPISLMAIVSGILINIPILKKVLFSSMTWSGI